MNNKIDFVLPWVDGSDKDWQKIKSTYENNKVSVSDGSNNARFRDMDTLKYVLRSIENNCPWYHKIHIITCGQIPSWLDVSHPKINLVTHEELYFKKEHLPIFSSSSIEMNLSNLKEASEKIVYLNDDMIINNPLDKERFFIEGKPVDFLTHGLLPRNKLFGVLKNIDSWINSLKNNINLINDKHRIKNLPSKFLFDSSYQFTDKLLNLLLKYFWKKYFWFEHWHHPQPYLKSTLKEVYTAFSKPMLACSSNKFRSNNDLTQYLYRYWHLAKGEFVPRKFNDGLINNITSKEVLKNMLKKTETNKQINFVCFNDSVHLSDIDFDDVKDNLTQYLNTKFSSKASFEK